VQGMTVRETPREHSFCAHAIQGTGLMTVPDATVDPRFADNPLVTGDPGIRFYAGYPICAPGGAKLGTLCIIDRQTRQLSPEDASSLRDLAELVEREIAMHHLASRDELTGLANKRGFEQVGSKVLDLCRRRAAPASLLYFDVDGLKPINDRRGHDAGDDALRDFARLLEHAFRESDVVARLGGDEFAVLLSGAADAAEALQRWESDPHQGGGTAVRLAASVGVAVFDPHGSESLEELTARADAAMYLHKEGKR
jgi:diguanylate cyclase (GGDEF)-like protein